MFAYKRHGVSYVARPPPSIRPRKGLFKKASNLNYGLNVAIRVEEIMAESGGQVTDPVEVGGSGAASDIFALCCWLVGWLVGLLVGCLIG